MSHRPMLSAQIAWAGSGRAMADSGMEQETRVVFVDPLRASRQLWAGHYAGGGGDGAVAKTCRLKVGKAAPVTSLILVEGFTIQ